MAPANKATILSSHSHPIPECSMCGDCGLSSELFQCKVCQFRSQHRYCSNLYPRQDCYQVCNWCLSHDTKEKSQNSSNSSSSNKNYREDDCKNMKIRDKKSNGDQNQISQGGIKSHRSALSLQINGPIKKPKSPERSPSTTTTPRRRLITNGKLEEKLRRTRSEDIPKTNGIMKQVYRNKVRRYKLLDEVSS
ncbi:hypothetical protein Tsubulata_029451 [Turnera subulata]|uniref:PHD-type zinc finger plants domain-containing protein n=1 Tax=Turnera subulata TaxID=218843 RepID=A0A9Q0FC21_9ROSI|nr:hypothetical protein Tsubulata_029451 [Turnera subulata]